MNRPLPLEQTPLSLFVRTHLAELGIKQSEFCRLTGFDQGLLSKIQSSMVSNLSLESTLRLALGLNVSPQVILKLINRPDLNELVVKSYSGELCKVPPLDGQEMSGPVAEICKLALRAYQLGHDLTPIIRALQPMVLRLGLKKEGA